ncbi:MAG: ATP-binding protein [bacterium]|nr:ATP-binding protein [bacterium]
MHRTKQISNRKKIRSFFALSLLLSAIVGAAQPTQEDSLMLLLKQADSREEQVQLLFEAAEPVLRTDSKQAIGLTRQALELVRGRQDTSTAKAYKFLQQAELYQGNFERGLLYNDSLMYLYRSLGDLEEQAWGLRSRGYIFLLQGEYNSAYEALLGALEANQQDYSRMMEFDIKLLLADVLTNLGDFEHTDSLYRVSIAVLDSLNRPNGVAFGHIHRGIGLQLQGRHQQALEVFRAGKQYAAERGMDYAMFSAGINMGWSFAQLEQADSALYYCRTGLEEYKRIGDIYGQAHCCKCLGYTYFKKGDIGSAEPELLKALDLYEKTGVTNEQKTVLGVLSDLYEQKGDAGKALGYHKAFKLLNDSLLTLDRSRQVAYMQTQFDVAEHKRANLRLQEKLALQDRLNKLYMVLGTLAVALITVLGFFYRLKIQTNRRLEAQVLARTQQLQNANDQLQLANQELRQFAYITSHDMKEPVRNINRFATLIGRRLKNGDTENMEEFLGYISRSALQLDELIRDVFSFTQLEETKKHYATTNLGELVRTVQTDLDSIIKEKNGTVAFAEQEMTVPDKLLKIVLKNLFENAWKYNQNEVARIELSCAESATHYTFRVADNGIGIPAEYDNYVFNMFKRLHAREEYTGSGLGLSIVKKLVNKMGGEIHIERPGLNDQGVTMVFTIRKREAL